MSDAGNREANGTLALRNLRNGKEASLRPSVVQGVDYVGRVDLESSQVNKSNLQMGVK